MQKKISKFIILLFSVSILFVPVFSQEKVLSEKERATLIKAYYDTAIRNFQSGDYSKAISYWEQILQLDPSQIQPPKLIAVAKQKIRDKFSKALKAAESYYLSGKYTAALSEVTTVLNSDPTNSELKNFYEQINNVATTLGDEVSQTRVGHYIRIAVNEYLKPAGKTKYAAHALIYASQLNPGDARIKKFLGIFTESYQAQVKAIETVPGMNLVEQKLVASLNFIYDAKYDRAIMECNDILELEPGNLMALKRLGSAYYALKKVQKAKEIWREALKINPKDAELKSYLK